MEELWQLDDETRRVPHWGVSEGKAMPLVPYKAGKSQGGKKKKTLTITNGPNGGYNSDDSMPSLETVSDSSEEEAEEEEESEWSDDYEEGSEDDDNESGYDTEEEEYMRDLLREAMDRAHANPDFMDNTKPFTDAQLADERKDNPFIKLLGSLRGTLSRCSLQLRA